MKSLSLQTLIQHLGGTRYYSGTPKSFNCLHFPSGLCHPMEEDELLHIKGMTRESGTLWEM